MILPSKYVLNLTKNEILFDITFILSFCTFIMNATIIAHPALCTCDEIYANERINYPGSQMITALISRCSKTWNSPDGIQLRCFLLDVKRFQYLNIGIVIKHTISFPCRKMFSIFWWCVFEIFFFIFYWAICLRNCGISQNPE